MTMEITKYNVNTYKHLMSHEYLEEEKFIQMNRIFFLFQLQSVIIHQIIIFASIFYLVTFIYFIFCQTTIILTHAFSPSDCYFIFLRLLSFTLSLTLTFLFLVYLFLYLISSIYNELNFLFTL